MRNLHLELVHLKNELKKNKMIEYGSFIDIQLSILKDPKISEDPKKIIKDTLTNAEWALKIQMDEIINKFNFKKK